MLPVLAHFLKKVCRDQSAGIQAWLAMAALLEVIHSGFSGKVTPNMVFRLAEDALGKWKDAGWPSRKKNHWVLHFYKSFQEHDFFDKLLFHGKEAQDDHSKNFAAAQHNCV